MSDRVPYAVEAVILPLARLGITRDPETGKMFTIPQETVTSAISTVLAEVTSLVSQGALVLIFVVLLLMGHKVAAGLLAGTYGHSSERPDLARP